jgi:hypothetical protein
MSYNKQCVWGKGDEQCAATSDDGSTMCSDHRQTPAGKLIDKATPLLKDWIKQQVHDAVLSSLSK